MAIGLLWGWGGSVGLEGICGAEGAVVELEGSLWGWGGSYGAAVGLEGDLWGWGGIYGAGGDSTVVGVEAH